jgi:lysophospholipase L1-like esterase
VERENRLKMKEPYKNPLLEPVCLDEVVFDWKTESWMGRHEAVCRAAAEGNPQVIFIGDSSTHFWEREGAEHWIKNYAQLHPINMGFGGDQIQHLLWRLQNGELEGIAPSLAVLLIGTNNSADNSADEIAKGIETVCALIREKLPTTHILLLAIFPRDTPGAARRMVNEAVNEKIARLDNGKWLHFHDFNKIWVDEVGVIKRELMEDLLHPTAAGYAVWAEKIRMWRGWKLRPRKR